MRSLVELFSVAFRDSPSASNLVDSERYHRTVEESIQISSHDCCRSRSANSFSFHFFFTITDFVLASSGFVCYLIGPPSQKKKIMRNSERLTPDNNFKDCVEENRFRMQGHH